MVGLPTAEQLEKLPLRAVAAYVARATRRVLPKLCGIVDDDIAEEAISIPERVASCERLDPADASSALQAAELMAKTAARTVRSQKYRAPLTICFGTLTAELLLRAAFQKDTERAARYARRAARAAARTADRVVRTLDEPMATAAAEAVRTDYETLLRTFGEHQSVVVGDPIDLSAASLLGPLMGRKGGQRGDH